MNIIKFLLAIALSVGLSSCVSAPKNISTGQSLADGEGIVVTKLRSNWKGYDNPLLANLEFFFGKADLNVNNGKFVMTRENDLKVITLPVGNYRWSHLGFGNRRLNFDRTYGFKVEPGTILYIGDINSELELGAFSAAGKFWVTNDTANIKDELESQYPDIMKKYPFVERMTVLNAQ